MQSSEELEKPREANVLAKIEELEAQIKADLAERTAMRQELAALRQKEVLLMQRDQGDKDPGILQ